jgi:hypothetical protein
MRINEDTFNAIWLPEAPLGDFGTLQIERPHKVPITIPSTLRPGSKDTLRRKAEWWIRFFDSGSILLTKKEKGGNSVDRRVS